MSGAPRRLFLVVGLLFLVYFFICCQTSLLTSLTQSLEFGSSSVDPSRTARVLRASAPGGIDAGVTSAAADDAIADAAARAELGKSTWHLLHRVAAGFDKSPTLARKHEIETFFKLSTEFYPCPECAKHFRDVIKMRPIDASDNRALSLWLCAAHNDVNKNIGKPVFPCTLDALKERWGKCGCFDMPTNSTTATDTV